MKPAAFLALIPSALGTTIYLAGDSTMAASGTGSGTAGTRSPRLQIPSPPNKTQDGAATSPPTPA